METVGLGVMCIKVERALMSGRISLNAVVACHRIIR